MRIIDNVSYLLGDDLTSEIGRGSKVRIAASTFSIFAFEALRKELSHVEELEFIFTSPSFTNGQATDKLRKDRREFFIPHAESSLYGSEFEIRLRNQLTQRTIARECAAWVREKVTFRSNTSGHQMQQFAVVDDRAAYMPLQGFTTADLGYERGNAVSNMVTKFEGASEASSFLNLFDQIWASPGQLDDVTQVVYDHIASVYAENSPARIYFLILYNLFAEFLDDISEDVLPNDRTGYQDTKVWQSLYNFQRDAATGIINKLETYNGCILADSVGLGKTFTALAVIKYYELRNKSVLVLAPKKLAENWTNYNANLTTNIFASDRFNYDVLAHTDLSRTQGESLGLRLDRINWGNYDLVVIDESHNFRNADYAEERESRYQRLMRQVIREGVNTKVLMLSATPVNNRFNDLKNQLQLAYEGESDGLADKLALSTSVERLFRDAQAVFNEWSKLPAEERTADRILQMLDFDFFELLDAVTIARSRKHIQAFYDTSEIGAFPLRLPPASIREPLTDLNDVPSFNEIFEQLQVLTLGVYTPLAYVFPSRISKYEDLYNVTTGNARSNLGQQGREEGLKRLMTVNLLKRLESSVEAFRLTLAKIESAVDSTLTRLNNHSGSLPEIRDMYDLDLDLDLDLDDEDDANVEALSFGEKIRIDIDDIDVESWQRDLWHDRETLRELLDEMRKVTPAHDLKLRKLRHLVQQKAYTEIDEFGRVFTRDNLASPNPRENLQYDVLHPVTGQPVPMHEYGWRLSRGAMDDRIAQGRILFGVDHTTTPRFKRLLSDMDRQAIRPVIQQERAPASDALSKLLDGKMFDYPKDVGVLRTWIDAVTSADKAAIILDFFAGSGSTAHAVMGLNAADQGSRRFILVQLDEAVEPSSLASKRGYATLADVARERLRRAGAEAQQVADALDSDLDVGFRSLRVATTNMADTLSTADDLVQIALTDSVDSVKPDRTDEDLLFQVLLGWGLELSSPITVEEVGSQRVLSIDDDALIACFANDVTDDLVKTIAARHPLRAVFLDAGFASDAARINAEQIFREVAPETEVRTI
jgi:hypothetical protein